MPEKTISQTETKVSPQDVYLQLIRMTSHNDFDGEVVALDLETNRELWKSCMMVSHVSGIFQLRDLPNGIHNVDTLLISFERQNLDKLVSMAEFWRPDTVNVLEIEGLSILKLWWD